MTKRNEPPSSLPVPALHRAFPQHLARRLWQIAATFQSEALAPFDIVPWQVALLAQLQDSPGRDRNWLAAAIGVDATSTGQALARFEARGLVAREINQQDRRANAFSLTPAGHALRAELAGPARGVARRLMAPLDEAEGATLLALLTRLVEAHEAHARPGAGRRPPRRAQREERPPCPSPSDAAPPAVSVLPRSSRGTPRRSPQPGRNAPSG
ncbi:MarR family winged helix-turn-helix transcriptional regulator [Roseomonas sp. HJA6]|uniref:MarR family winged helix-turn-helix transcriptional regulator n=1 Tax=Roseomonas alba TaxID=2846776 RepID=A0ABS7A6I0_9PROT|nr:MarR family winged helix-turn-helix transcriptional regulator [Neoroseomonas alba]MBW6397908.1 MarR family winged helix-turn-helix transcriptional regulator [Neoroseomonas alba]